MATRSPPTCAARSSSAFEAREKTKPIDGEPTLGRLKDVAYWPANEPIPERFKGYTQDASTWELRDVRDGKAMMWRDFTEAERTRMGEIDDIRYALVRTMQLAVQDVETGKCPSGWRTTTARSWSSCRTAPHR